jgi:hypothetical protein
MLADQGRTHAPGQVGSTSHSAKGETLAACALSLGRARVDGDYDGSPLRAMIYICSRKRSRSLGVAGAYNHF